MITKNHLRSARTSVQNIKRPLDDATERTRRALADVPRAILPNLAFSICAMPTGKLLTPDRAPVIVKLEVYLGLSQQGNIPIPLVCDIIYRSDAVNFNDCSHRRRTTRGWIPGICEHSLNWRR
jgi:hypothetical protein